MCRIFAIICAAGSFSCRRRPQRYLLALSFLNCRQQKQRKLLLFQANISNGGRRTDGTNGHSGERSLIRDTARANTSARRRPDAFAKSFFPAWQ